MQAWPLSCLVIVCSIYVLSAYPASGLLTGSIQVESFRTPHSLPLSKLINLLSRDAVGSDTLVKRGGLGQCIQSCMGGDTPPDVKSSIAIW